MVERDADGDLLRASWRRATRPRRGAEIKPDRGEARAKRRAGRDRLLVRFERTEGGDLEARLIKRLGQSAHRILGVVRKLRGEAHIEPVDRKSRERLVLNAADGAELRDGDLVLAEVGPGPRPLWSQARPFVGGGGAWGTEPRAASIIAINSHGIDRGLLRRR